jgi:ADP-heptose:LPS heptosyltransferase
MFNVRASKCIDRYAGAPICAFLCAIKSAGRLLRRLGVRPAASTPGSEKPINKILMIKFFGMGSIVLNTPLLRCLSKAYPAAEICFLTYGGNRALLDLYPMVDRVIAMDSGKGIIRFLFSVPCTLWKLRRERFDVVLDLEFFSYFTAITTYATGCDYTLGYRSIKTLREPFYNRPVSYDGSRHLVPLSLKFADAMGIAICGEELEAPTLSDKDIASMEKRLTTLGLEGDALLCVNINASELAYTRRWPLEYYSEVLRRMARERDCAIVLIGSRGDRAYVEEFISCNEELPLYNAAGLFGIAELSALLERSRLLLTNDSGPLHLACAVKTPTVSIFGPETPALYGPQGKQHTIFFGNEFCSPCLSVYNAKTFYCTNLRCVKNIKPGDVYDAVALHFSASKGAVEVEA